MYVKKPEIYCTQYETMPGRPAGAASAVAAVAVCCAFFTIAVRGAQHTGTTDSVTVSGISAGAFFAVQFHVAFSDRVTGAGVVAGGPFWCAQAKLPIATTACMVTPSLISVDELVLITHATHLSGFIDDPANLKDDAVFLFSGTKDTVVEPGVVAAALEYYKKIGTKTTVFKNDIAAEHSMPTLHWGNPCQYKGSPYINACSFDAAGQILLHVYNGTGSGTRSSGLVPPVKPIRSNIISFDQNQFALPATAKLVGLGDTGYAYVPRACAKYEKRLLANGDNDSGHVDPPSADATAACRIHAVFHGCLQNANLINTTFVEHSGYNSWAEANDIVVLYPQSRKSPVNPKSCFDWWGYSGPEYASNVGVQMVTVNRMVNRLLE